jgi:O-antigen/teichoic acid export membrane protein
VLKKEVSGILKHSSIYGFGNMLHRLPPFILLPVYLNYLSPTDFGKKEVVALIIDFLGIVISMGIASAMARFYYEYEDERNQKEVVSTIVLSYAGLGGILIGLVGTQASRIAAVVTDDPADKNLILLALASLWMNTIYQMFCDYLRIREKSIAYVSISLSKLTLALVLNVLFIVKMGYGILGIFLSTFVSALAFTVLMSVPMLFKVGARISPEKLKDILRFGAPLVIAQLAGTVVHLSDRFFVKEYISLASAGIYTLGYRLGNSVNMLVNSPFQQIWNPRRFSLQKLDQAKAIYASVFTYYLFIMFFFGAILAACARDIIIITGQPQYYEAATVAPLITLAYILFGAQNHFTTGLMIRKKTKYFAYINVVLAVINISLNFALIPTWGIMGAAYATLISMAVKFMITALFSQKVYPMDWEWKRITRILLAGLAAFAASLVLRYPPAFDSYLLDYQSHLPAMRLLGAKYFAYHLLVVTAVYLTIIILPGFLNPQERAFAGTQLARIRNRKGQERA